MVGPIHVIVFWRVWISSNKSSHHFAGGPTLLATSTAAKKVIGSRAGGDGMVP